MGNGAASRASLWLRRSDRREYLSSFGVKSPAGSIATPVRARPRAASSPVIQPPIELPTMWAVSQPTASSSRSTASTRAGTVGSSSSGGDSP